MDPGTLLANRYEVIRKLGVGGLGTTYLALDLAHDAEVALKLARGDQPDAHRAFFTELACLRGLVHPRLAQLRDFGEARLDTDTAAFFYTSELVVGVALDVYARGRRWPELVRPIGDAIEALGFLHAQGFRHGDVKAENVLVTEVGRGVLIDLSCGQMLGRAVREVSGTPGSIAPELLERGIADRKSDLYSLGVMLDAIALASGVPPLVRAVIERLRHADPAQRPSDAAEVLEAIGITGGSPRAACAHASELVGRREPLALFESMIDALATRAPGPRVIVVHGQEGMGKSRLLAEMKWLAQRRVAVVEGSAGRDDCLASMLRRATGKPDAHDDVVSMLRALDTVTTPTVLVLDDADQLDGAARTTWLALLRTLGPDSAMAAVASEAASCPLEGEAVRQLPLEPLGKEDLGAWSDRFPPHRFDEVLRATGGAPGAIQRLAATLGDSEIAEEDLLSAAEALDMPKARQARLGALPSSERRALASLAATRSALDGESLRALGIDIATIASLAQAGWVLSDGSGYRLARRSDAAAAMALVEQGTLQSIHRTLATIERQRLAHLAPMSIPGSSCAAAVARHLRDAGDKAGSLEAMRASSALWELHPDAWVVVARAFSDGEADEPTLLACHILETAGRADEAIALVAKMMRRRPAPPLGARVRLRAAAAYLRGSRPKRALSYLRRLSKQAGLDDGDRARVLDLTSRSYVKIGDYDAALRAAKAGLDLADTDALAADLHDDVGVAASYTGDVALAKRELDEAAALHQKAARPRAHARSAIYRALADYRAGDARAAAEGFSRALAIAEQAGATDLAVYAAQNAGTAAHQLGDLATAHSSYEHARRVASALGDLSTEAALLCNLAKLYSDVGSFERAIDCAARGELAAERAELPLIAATAASVAGEVAIHRADGDTAMRCLRRALSRSSGAPRELAETHLHVADAHLLDDDLQAATRALGQAKVEARHVAAPDLDAKIALASARLAMAKDAPSEAMAELERALALAERSGQRELSAEAHAWLARACHRQGAHILADKHVWQAREIWERTATSLPRQLADGFWQHPARQLPPTSARGEHATIGGPRSRARPRDRERQLERLLDINKKLNSSLETAQILSWTIDSALELTAAERGFVILGAEGGKKLDIAVARNIDAQPAADLDFSKSIALQVIRTGHPVVTVDARHDARFEGQQSVHAMRLTSVISVPIVAPQGVIGALYLDHRFRRGLFEPEQVELLSAFADQVAIALTNARLHQELARRSQELDRALAGRERQIDDLTLRIRAQQEALEYRFDYSRIVGGDSAAMQRMFRTLDKVIDTDVPVLLSGESGTGKELIAKAIHYNGARKDGPMVSVNCGALPEPLLESELFGHLRGTFTGANRDRDGLFVSAKGGTIFLDEVGEMPPAMQVKLLRVLQEQEVTPLGGRRAVPIDARLLSATNRTLLDDVQSGRFREDLYYRIGVVDVRVPPLSERTGDMPALVAHLVGEAARKAKKKPPKVTRATMQALLEHRWPGNVRELENVLTKAVLLSDGDAITPDMLQLAPSSKMRTRAQFQEDDAAGLLAALRATRWNVSEAARRLGLSRPTVYRKMRRYGMDAPGG